MEYDTVPSSGVLSPAAKNGLAAACGVAALLLFWVTLSPSAFPGESAELVATRLGIDPRLTPDHPLWQAATAWCALLPSGLAVYALNLWSALCGALAVGLLGRYVVGWTDARIVLDEDLDERFAGWTALLAGGVAALAFATSAPLWAASTRLHTASFHALLLLAGFNLLLDIETRGGRWRAYALALLCGAGCAETELFLAVTPYFAGRLLIALYRRDEISWGRVVGLALTGLLGASLYGVAAWQFSGSAGMALRGYVGRVSIITQMLLDQLAQLSRMLPREGWIWVLLFTLGPWLATQFEVRHGLNRRRDVTALFFHVLLSVMVALVLFNNGVLPWAGTLPVGRLPVLELLLTAHVAGYLAAFWFIRLAASLLAAPENDEGGERSRTTEERVEQRAVNGTACGVFLLCIALAALANGPLSSGRRAGFADAYVRALLEQLQDRTWLVTDGQLDAPLRVEASLRGQPLHVVNLAADRHPIHIRRLRADISADPLLSARAVVYRNAANLGAASFLQEWLADDSNAVARIAFYAAPDLMFEAGCTPFPDRLLFLGTHGPERLKKQPFLDEHAAFWTRMESLLAGAAEGDPIHVLRGSLRRHVSMTANNLGVLLEDLGRRDDAYAAYQKALAFDPQNFSAMLNRVVLTRVGVRAEDKVNAEADANEALDRLKRMPDAGRLARFYGYVRVPSEFARQSSEWMRFGQPQMATAVLRHAMSMAPEDQRLGFLKNLAAIQLYDRRPEETEALLLAVLKKTPLDMQALRGMVRVALMKQDFPAARKWLDEVELAGVAAETLVIEHATVDIAEGRFDEARRRLQALTDSNPRLLEAWALQANLLLSQGKVAEVEKEILPRMKAAGGKTPTYLAALTEGYTRQAKGPSSFEAAREAFLLALKFNPGNRSVLSEVLKLDYALRDEASAERHAQALLRGDRNDAAANYALGTIMIGRNDLEGAEAHLRRAAAGSDFFSVWNDLAETLRLLHKLPEAEEAARKALVLNPSSANAHDTLAAIQLDAGRLDDAQRAATEALRLDPKSPPLLLTQAKIAARRGETVEARDLVRQLTALAERLSPQQRGELEALAAELKRR